MPDHDSADGEVPAEGDDPREVTARPWSAGDVVRLGTVDSTNRYALDAARAGRNGGFVVVCDHQTAGRGRRGRSWVAPAAGSLLCSVLFRPRLEIEQCGLLTFAVACAALEAIEETTGTRGSLKWPNDVLIGERKVAGVLADVGLPVGNPPSPVVVVGIGVNVAFPPGWLDDALGDDDRPISVRATTIEEATGVVVGRDALLDALLQALDRRVGHAPGPEVAPPLLAEARERSSTIGRTVRIEDADGTRVGLATGISPTGRLEVEFDGVAVVLDAADVHHLR